MKRYEVFVPMDLILYSKVEANSKEEAFDKAWKKCRKWYEEFLNEYVNSGREVNISESGMYRYLVQDGQHMGVCRDYPEAKIVEEHKEHLKS